MRKEEIAEYSSILLLLIVFAFSLLGTSSSVFGLGTKKAIVEERGTVVARVNGQPIYEDALTPFIQREMKKYKKYSANRDKSRIEKHLQKKAVMEVISRELLYQESLKIQVKDAEKKIAERMKKVKNKHQTDEQFEEYLKSKGRTEKDVRENIRKSIYVDEYLKMKGMRDPEVPEEEIREFYNDSKNSFRRQESIMASHILIAVKEDAKPEEKEEARAKAEKIREEILAGGDFAEMAKKHSEDARAPQGGDLGYIQRRYMPSEFDEAAFALQEGAVSEVVQTRHGYHIIKVVDRIPEGVAPYEEVRDFIAKYLQGQIERRNYLSHVEELKNRATIEILLNGSSNDK